MPVTAGNLLTDPQAQSFISREDAVDYLQAERFGCGAIGEWLDLPEAAQEASLIRASRWMASALRWCNTCAASQEQSRIGWVAARLAAETYNTSLWAGENSAKRAKRYKADGVEIEYFDDTSAGQTKVAGLSFPWVDAMLRGLLCGPKTFHDVVRR